MGIDEIKASSSGWSRPWQARGLAGIVTLVALVVGIPPFLHMPPWCDLTLYDVAARNLLLGGVHYRDVFDTNMPGFVWALAGIRAIFGWSVEAVRAVDLGCVVVIAFLLDRLARLGGAPPWARLWSIAAIAVFYPFQSEFVHAQRDVWMLVPALAAVTLRVRRLLQTTVDTPLMAGLVQGVLWGFAVWIKPHVIIPAGLVWLASVTRTLDQGGRPLLLRDFLGNFLGGLIVGTIGISYMVATGTWAAFLEVFTFWNTGYAEVMLNEFPFRVQTQLHYFPPWSYLQIFAVSVAVGDLLDGRPWRREPTNPSWVSRRLPAWLWSPAPDPTTRLVRVILASLYLGWTAQAFVFQRDFHYVHVPEIFLLLAVLAANRWAAGFLGVAWLTLANLLILAGAPADSLTADRSMHAPGFLLLIPHPAFDAERLQWWPECWSVGLTPARYRARMNALRQVKSFHSANDWEELGEVADWLKAQNVRDGEVLCWHDAPHALYLELQVRPGFRFQHVGQMLGIGQSQADRIMEELCAARPHVRYVVSDLMRVHADYPELVGDPRGKGDDFLPPTMDPILRDEFPYDQPAVFRSAKGHGRYVVHILPHPILGCEPGE